MATAQFIYDGNSIDYTPTANVSAGEVVVQNDLVGVAKLDIAANTLGALAVTGVFDFPKEAALAIAVGVNCYWKTADEVVNTVATGNKLVGKCVKAATETDTTVRVRLSQ